MSTEPSQLSLYELHRTPQEVITDPTTEIAVSPSLHSELMCPICLDTLKKTMTTKECLHRFCSDCIITALRTGNKECPTCRKKLVSKRSLRPDPNFDLLISKIYPSRDEYEAPQERELAKINMSHSKAPLVNSITEGIKLQSQNRPQRSRKTIDYGTASISSSTETAAASSSTARETIAANPLAVVTRSRKTIDNGTASISRSTETAAASSSTARETIAANPLAVVTPAQSISKRASVRSTPYPVPSSLISFSKNAGTSVTKREESVMMSERSEESESSDGRTEGENSMDTEGEGEPLNPNEIELVLKPHPMEMTGDNQLMRALRDTSVLYLKTTANASVDHLRKYLAMRLTPDLDAKLPEADRLLNSCIYVAPTPGQFVALSGSQTLRQINDKFWKVNKPLEIIYSWKKT